MPSTVQDMLLVFIRFMAFCKYVGWSKLIFINTILCKSTLNNDYMMMMMMMMMMMIDDDDD